MAHLTRAFKLVESSCHLFPLHQNVGTMQKQHVYIIGVEPLKASLYRLCYMPVRKVIKSSVYSTLCLNYNLISHGGCNNSAENSFALALSVNIGMVEKIRPVFKGSFHKLGNTLFIHCRYAHTAHCNGRHT